MRAWLELAGLKPLDDPPEAEMVAFERLVNDLDTFDVALPRWVLWDLANLNRGASGMGARFDSSADGLAWRRWLLRKWRPLLAGSAVKGLGPLGLLQVTSVVQAWASRESTSSTDSGAWDWKGAGVLLDAARADADPRRFLGATSVSEAAGWTSMADPFLELSDAESIREERVRLLGSFTTAGSDGIRRGPSGEFDRRLPGPLPGSAARIDPFDLMLAKDVPDLFMQRVAESAVGQRYFKVSRPSRTVPRVLLDVTVVDSVDANRFEEAHLPPSSRAKLLGVRLAARACAMAFPDVRSRRPAVDLHLDFRFEPALRGLPVERVRILAADQCVLSRGSLQGTVDWLTERLPGFASRAPVPGRRRLPLPGVRRADDDALGWDRRVSIRVGRGGGPVASIPDEGRWDLLLELVERLEGGWNVCRPGHGVVEHHADVHGLVDRMERAIFDARPTGASDSGESPVVELA